MSSHAQQARTLVEALPYIQKFTGKTIVVKYGGNAMVSDELRRAVMCDIILLSLVGIRVVVVHGGGPEISEMLKKLGHESRFVDGLRYTDAETMDVVQSVLCGKVNKNLVAQLNRLGGQAIGLCGMSDEAIPDAETVLPKNLCPLIKGTYGFALTEKCPYTYFSDIIVGETTCDGKKKMYELLGELKRTHILHLPQGRDRAYEREGWYEECRLLKEELEGFYGITITDDDLRAAVRRRNRLRAPSSRCLRCRLTSRRP